MSNRCTITTADELDALPIGSVARPVRAGIGPAILRIHQGWSMSGDAQPWATGSMPGRLDSGALIEASGPWMVLYRPDAPARGPADAETLRAEVERLRSENERLMRDRMGWWQSAADADAERDAARTEAATLRTAIEGLIEDAPGAPSPIMPQYIPVVAVASLRAVLAAHPAPEAAPPARVAHHANPGSIVTSCCTRSVYALHDGVVTTDMGAVTCPGRQNKTLA